MTDCRHDDPASEFVVRWTGALATAVPPPRRALDVAMGRGRHARLLARSGFRVFGVDAHFDAVRDAVARAAGEGTTVRGWCADLTRSPLPRGWFALVVVTRYLQRDLFPAIAASLAPGGVLLYETFTEAQRALGRGPSSPEHLLRPGELRAAFSDLELLFYEEASGPEAVARLVARRQGSGAWGHPPERESLRSSGRS
jgi:SAM-dependent methyltransferase